MKSIATTKATCKEIGLSIEGLPYRTLQEALADVQDSFQRTIVNLQFYDQQSRRMFANCSKEKTAIA